MAFDSSPIGTVTHTQQSNDLLVRWTSTAPAGTRYQVYVDRKLVWSGFALSCHLQAPPPPGNHQIDVGAVGSGEARTDFGSTLPATLGPSRAVLAWSGGRYLADDIESFAVYMGLVAGGAVSYTTPVAVIPAYPGGILTDGYGMGGYGKGGYGRAASSYGWTSPPLGSGTWNFGIVSRDSAGNQSGSPLTGSVVIATPPRPPAASGLNTRLSYAYNPGTQKATLSWLASPG